VTYNWHITQQNSTAIAWCISDISWKPSATKNHWILFDPSCNQSLIQPEVKRKIAVRIWLVGTIVVQKYRLNKLLFSNLSL
jgi:hypothetical protein